MSILNAWVEREQAWVGVDTGLFGPAGEALGDVGKMVPLVHINAVLAFRGQYAVFAMIHSLVVWQTSTFDALIGEMPGILKDSVSRTADALKGVAHAPAADSLPLLNLVLVGWSPRRGRMMGYQYEHQADRGTWLASELSVGNGFFGPADDAFMDQLECDAIGGSVEEKMLEVARRQMILARERHPVRSTGGRLILAKLDRVGMVIRDVATLTAIGV